MNIYEKLLNLQQELKAPKTQYNDFGKYNYRNAEDILEVAKPLCAKYKVLLFLSDTINNIGNRNYVETTATLIDIEKSEDKIIVTASAREEETKKGMDGSQITGASSSYARKYALNGLFDIDDTKDSDTTNTGESSPPQTAKKTVSQPAKEPVKRLPMTLPDAEAMTAKMGNKDVKFKDLTDEQLAKLTEYPREDWKEAAQLILQFRMKKFSDEMPDIDKDLPF